MPPERRKQISDTNKKLGIKPTKRYDPTGKKHKPSWSEKMRATMRKKYPPVVLQCLTCKKDFEVPKRQASWRKTCSRECQHYYEGSKKGWVLPIYRKIRASKKYVEWRNKIFERDNWTCKICGQQGGKLHVDHIKKFAEYPKLRFKLSNGRTLCVPCHKSTPNYGNKHQRKTNNA